MSGVYLQSPHCGGVGGERDSGYDSLRRRMSVLDRLTQTHPVWLLLAVSEDEADRVLIKQPPGVRGYAPTNTNVDVSPFLKKYYLRLSSVSCRCSWSGSRPLCRGRFCLCV